MSESALPAKGGFALTWPAGNSEQRLARRAAAGDERAFAAIFRRYGPELHRYCLAIVGNRDDAQDALQNVMLKALRSLPGERREIKLRPWLYRVAHNESVELLRRRREAALDPEAAAPGTDLAETAAQRQRLRRLFADLRQLPERQRGALVMRELSGLDFEQIGAALGSSAAAARQTAYEARLGLREMEAGREMSCDLVTKAISDGDGRVLRRRDVRAHLRGCAECRAFRAGIEDRRRDLAALSPLPAMAIAAVLKGALGSSAGGGAAAGTGGGAGAAVGIGAAGGGLVKAVATVAVVAAIGAGAADRAGLVHIGGADGGRAGAERVAGGSEAAGTAGGRNAASGARLTRAERLAQRSDRNPGRPGLMPAAAAPGPAAHPPARPFDRGQAGARPGGEAGSAEPSAHGRGKGLREGGGRRGNGPPAHSHAGGNPAGGRANAAGGSANAHGNPGGSSASAHTNAGSNNPSAAEHRVTHTPGSSQARGSKNGKHSAGDRGKSAPHAAAPPPSSPHQPAQPKAPHADSPAAGTTEAAAAPEAGKGKGPPAATESESSP